VDGNDPIVRQLVNALFPNHAVGISSGNGIWAILLPSGWDGDFQVGPDLQSISILNKVPKVTNDANKLVGQHGMDESNVNLDALIASTKERNKKYMKDQGVNNVEDISNDVVLWHFPFKICGELFDIRGRELDQIFFEPQEK
jgi:hypothetical protein